MSELRRSGGEKTLKDNLEIAGYIDAARKQLEFSFFSENLYLALTDNDPQTLKQIDHQLNAKGLTFASLLTEITDSGNQQKALELFKQLKAEVNRNNQPKIIEQIIALTHMENK